MLDVLHKVLRVVLIIIPIFILGWLIAKEIVPSGKLEAVYDMRRETPFVSKLYPKDRISEAKQGLGDDFYRIFFTEPVYFDLKPNDYFEKVSVTVSYKNNGSMPIKFGGLINKQLWVFDWRDLPPTGEVWQNKTEIFDFSKIIPEGDSYRFGFSAAGMEQGQISISEIKVLFVRPELDERGVINKILEGIVWRINKVF